MLELIAPTVPSKGPVNEYLEKYGEGLHHIAYRVENLKEMLSEMKKDGVKLKDNKPRPGAAGSWVAFVNPEETSNVLTELVQREEDL